MAINRKYKNSIFTLLFNDPVLLRELYCALKGAAIPPDIPISVNTLENVLFMDFINDISFEIGGKLVVLIEHQSTINPNMTLRLLFYYSKLMEKMIKSSNIYSRKQLSIPWPEFYVLYNGRAPYPENVVLKLSDLFEKPRDLGLPENACPMLDLEVKIININEGKNIEIVNRCRKLSEYSVFTARVNASWDETGDLETAIKSAITYCSRHDILGEFLEIHGSEVLNMLLAEWNMEDAIAYAREEAREEGCEERTLSIAGNMLAEGMDVEFIQKITGLDAKTIQGLNR